MRRRRRQLTCRECPAARAALHLQNRMHLTAHSPRPQEDAALGGSRLRSLIGTHCILLRTDATRPRGSGQDSGSEETPFRKRAS